MEFLTSFGNRNWKVIFSFMKLLQYLPIVVQTDTSFPSPVFEETPQTSPWPPSQTSKNQAMARILKRRSPWGGRVLSYLQSQCNSEQLLTLLHNQFRVNMSETAAERIVAEKTGIGGREAEVSFPRAEIKEERADKRALSASCFMFLDRNPALPLHFRWDNNPSLPVLVTMTLRPISAVHWTVIVMIETLEKRATYGYLGTQCAIWKV